MGILSFTPVDLTNPVFPAWVEPIAPTTPDQENRYSSTVAFVQDQISIGGWHILASLRQSHIKVDDVNTSLMFGQNNHSTNNKTTPRFGVVYEFTPQWSVFSGYSEGIKVPTGSIFSTPPKPEEYAQKELGLRLNNLSGVTATLALFDLTRKNATMADPNNVGFSIQAGEQQSKGLDIDVKWQATPAWSWLAALTKQTAETTKDSNTALLNKQLFNVPEKSARLATHYNVIDGTLTGLSVGFGASYNSERAGDSTNTFFTPSTTVFDAQIAYQLKNTRLGFNIVNVTDKKYYVPSTYFGGGQVIPASPRTFSATASYAF